MNLSTLSVWGCRGLELILVHIGREAGSTRIGHQSSTGLTQTSICIHINSYREHLNETQADLGRACKASYTERPLLVVGFKATTFLL